MVGFDGKSIIAIELKKSLSHSVIRQAMINQIFADQSFCAVPTNPRNESIDRASRHGLGILKITNDRVELIASPEKRSFNCTSTCRTIVMRQINNMRPGGVGGIPTPVNDGPAQQVARLVAPLLRDGIGWPEIYELVPNHYAHAKSLRGAMMGYGPARAIIDKLN